MRLESLFLTGNDDDSLFADIEFKEATPATNSAAGGAAAQPPPPSYAKFCRILLLLESLVEIVGGRQHWLLTATDWY